MARYRKIDTRVWNDEKFRCLSDRGKLAFFLLLTHPHMTSLGAMRGTIGALAAEIGWTEKAFREAFGEAFRKGMCEVDEKASFVGLPNFLKYNGPESPNVVKSWAEALDLIPECEAKCLLIQRVKGVTASEGIRRILYPGFVEALGLIGSSQVQGRCSAGGNLCNASPAADSVCAMIVNRAVGNVVGPGGQRSVPVEEFNVGPARNCLAPDELLVSIDFPVPAARTADAYLRLIPRSEMDIAVAGAAVSLTLDENDVCTDARVAIVAVAPRALLVAAAAEALIGSTVDEAALQKAGAAASAAASPITEKRGTPEYRRKVVGVVVRRAATIAKARVQARAKG